MIRLLSFIFLILTSTTNASTLADIKSEAHNQLSSADNLLVNAMALLQLSYVNEKLSLSNQTTCYDDTTCSALQTAGVSNLTVATSSAKTASHIAYITAGFIPSSSSATCNVDTNLYRTPVDSSGFSTCSLSSYTGQLAIEVRFKSSSYNPGISGVLDNKTVLFLAKGPGINSQFITNTVTPPSINSIGSYDCINNDGTNQDGINNGSRLGSIYIQNSVKSLLTFLTHSQSTGGFSLCLR